MRQEDFINPSGSLVTSMAGYLTFVPQPLPPELSWSPELVKVLSEANRYLGELAGLGRTLSNPHLLVRPFVRREAVLSSKIEGTQASLEDLYRYEAVQLSFLEKGSDVQEVQNYVQALEYGLDRLNSLPVSLRLMCELHGRLLEGVRGNEFAAGEYRRGQNFIGPPGSSIETAIYVPPAVPDMLPALDSFEKYIHSPSDLPHLIRLGMIHYQFEAIHPFADGNGRLGRLLISLLLCSWGLIPQPLLYLSAYFEKYRSQYYDRLLKVSQANQWEDWLTFFLSGIVVQSQDASFRIKKLQDLRDRYHDGLQKGRAPARLLQVVDLLFQQPIITMKQVETDLDINFTAAKRYVEQLVTLGVLHEVTGYARNRIYRADEIMQTIEGPIENL